MFDCLTPYAQVSPFTVNGEGAGFLHAFGPLETQAYSNRHFSKLTDKEKLANTKHQATLLFTHYKDNLPGLLDALKQLGVEVYSAKEHPWVTQVCREMGAEAACVYPFSVLYPNDTAEVGPVDPKSANSLFGDYLEKKKRFAILVGAKPTKEIIIHEVFHLLQLINGLPFGTGIEADTIANGFRNMIVVGLSNFLRCWRFEFIRLPWMHFKTFFGLIKENPKSPGFALRDLERREFEACKFVTFHGGKFGVSLMDRLKSLIRMANYQMVFDYSYTLDEQYNKGQRQYVIKM